VGEGIKGEPASEDWVNLSSLRELREEGKGGGGRRSMELLVEGRRLG